MGRDSSVGIANMLRAGLSGDRIPVWARFSAPVQTGPGAHPASCRMVTGSFPGVKRPGRGVDHPPPSSAEVKERVELYLYSPSGPFVACSRENFVSDTSDSSFPRKKWQVFKITSFRQILEQVIVHLLIHWHSTYEQKHLHIA